MLFRVIWVYLMLLKLLSLAFQFVNKFTLRSFNRNFRVDFWVYFEYIVCFYDDATFVLQLSKNEEGAEIKQKATEIEYT